MIARLRQELDGLHGSPFLCGLQRAGELEQLPVSRLQQLRAQLHHDLNALDKVKGLSFFNLNCFWHLLCQFGLVVMYWSLST